MIYDAFDLVAVPFPFVDKQTRKRRPALVLSSNEFNRNHDQLMLAMITTAKAGAWVSDVEITQWRAAGLITPCRVRFKLFTLESVRVLRSIGHLV